MGPESIQGVNHMEKFQESEVKETRSANAPRVGKRFFGTFSGKKDDRVTGAQGRGRGSRRQDRAPITVTYDLVG